MCVILWGDTFPFKVWIFCKGWDRVRISCRFLGGIRIGIFVNCCTEKNVLEAADAEVHVVFYTQRSAVPPFVEGFLFTPLCNFK